MGTYNLNKFMLDTVDLKRSFLKQRDHGLKLFFWEKIFEPPPFQANDISNAPSLFPNPSPSILTHIATSNYFSSQGGRLAVHVLALAGAGPLRRLLLHRPLRRPGLHEGPTALRHPEAHDRLQLLPDPSQPVGFPESLLLLVDRPLQLALPTRRLLQHRGRHAGRRHDLVVLLLKVHRLPRLLLLRAAEKMEPPQHTPCGSPWHHAFHCLVGHSVSGLSAFKGAGAFKGGGQNSKSKGVCVYT